MVALQDDGSGFSGEFEREEDAYWLFDLPDGASQRIEEKQRALRRRLLGRTDKHLRSLPTEQEEAREQSNEDDPTAGAEPTSDGGRRRWFFGGRRRQSSVHREPQSKGEGATQPAFDNEEDAEKRHAPRKAHHPRGSRHGTDSDERHVRAVAGESKSIRDNALGESPGNEIIIGGTSDSAEPTTLTGAEVHDEVLATPNRRATALDETDGTGDGQHATSYKNEKDPWAEFFADGPVEEAPPQAAMSAADIKTAELVALMRAWLNSDGTKVLRGPDIHWHTETVSGRARSMYEGGFDAYYDNRQLLFRLPALVAYASRERGGLTSKDIVRALSALEYEKRRTKDVRYWVGPMLSRGNLRTVHSLRPAA